MTLKTIPISVTITAPDGTPAAGANVLAELTAHEIDGMIIVPSKVSATTDTAGVAVMRLWPNARGAAGSQYRIAAVKAGVLLLNVLATVPDGLSTTEIPLQAIITTAPYPPVSESLAALLAAQAAAVDALQQADIATAKAVLAADAVVLTHADVEATGADRIATSLNAEAVAAGLVQITEMATLPIDGGTPFSVYGGLTILDGGTL